MGEYWMLKILIIEDDIKIREIILCNLKKWDFAGKAVKNFKDVFNVFIDYQPHLILLDINLPYYDGFYWCNKIREVSKVPIVFITSRDSNMDIIMAMNMGGDDYIKKPFSLEVLMAKIKAILRRTYSYTSLETDVCEYNDVVLNLKNYCILYRDNKIELSKNEFRIINLLMKNGGQVVSRDKIMQSLWKDESFIDDNTLTVNINRLRKKLSHIGLENFIKTKRGEGYIIK